MNKIEKYQILLDNLEDILDLYKELDLDDSELKAEINWIKEKLENYKNEKEEETAKQVMKIYDEILAEQNQFKKECI